MITYNKDNDIRLEAARPQMSEAPALAGVWLPATDECLWRRVDDAVGAVDFDVPAGTFTGTGVLKAVWTAVPAAQRSWDSSNGWEGWTPSTSAARGAVMRVELAVQGNGKYRADMQYATRANGRTLTVTADAPVVAMKCRVPDGSVITWDVVGASGRSLDTKKCSGVKELRDGFQLLWCDLSQWAEGAAGDDTPFVVFQIKIADIPAAAVGDGSTAFYDVWWVGAFASVETACEHLDPERCLPGAWAGQDKIFLGGDRRPFSPGGASSEELEELKCELAEAQSDLAYAHAQLESTQGELAEKIKELAALAGREPADYWLDCVDRGRNVLDALMNMYANNNTPSWANTVEAAAGVTAPYILPAFALPATMPNGMKVQAEGVFVGCENLLYCPEIDLGESTSARQMFNTVNLSSLLRLPKLDTSGITNMASMFGSAGCVYDWPDYDYSAVKNISNFFRNTPNVGAANGKVREIRLPEATNLDFLFNGAIRFHTLGRIHAPKNEYLRILQIDSESARLIRRVEGIDMDSIKDRDYVPYICLKEAYNLTYMMLFNLGMSGTELTVKQIPNWGAGNAESRQSLVDSLITNSCDRTAAGMEPYRLTLTKATLARLTDEEIAQITAKGFTLISV